MRRPRRRLVYTMGLRDPSVPSGVPPDAHLKCDDDDFGPAGGDRDPAAAAAVEEAAPPPLPSPSPPPPPGASCSPAPAGRTTLLPGPGPSALQKIRWEVQQLELEANYARLVQDVSTSRLVLEELVDAVVAAAGGTGGSGGDGGGMPSSAWAPSAGHDSVRGGAHHAGGGSVSLLPPRSGKEEVAWERRFATRVYGNNNNAAAAAAARGRQEEEQAGPAAAVAAVQGPRGEDNAGVGVGVGVVESTSTSTSASSTGMMGAAADVEPYRCGEEQQGGNGRAAEASAAAGPGGPSLALPAAATPLDHSMWGTLPSDLIDRILARLPLPCLLRYRAVCRTWNRTLLPGGAADPDRGGFLAVYAQVPPHKPWLFTWDSWIEDDSHAYNPRLDRWHRIPLRFIPHEHVKRPLHIVGAVGGLLFFEYFARLYIALCVCNPVTKAWRKLPALHEKRVQPVVAVVQHGAQGRGEFTVVVAGGLSKPSVMHKVYSTEVFKSGTNRWHKTCDTITPDGGHIRWGPYVRTAFCNGTLYYMLWRFQILAYNLTSGSWTHVLAPSPPALDPESGISPFLVECKGRLLMVGFLQDTDGGHVAPPPPPPQQQQQHAGGLAVWELNAAGTAWAEVARMPDELFARMPLRKIQGVGCAGLIYIFETFSAPVVVCDVSGDAPEWRLVDSGCIKGNHRVIYGCATDLRLDAPV